MYKDRTIYPVLAGQLENPKIIILMGARQVGKTTLMRRLYEEVRQRYRALFFDLDLYSQYEQVSTYENLINTLKLNGYDERAEERFVLFLDEFQRYDDLSRVMKTMCDHHPQVKIYASGSSSLAIHDQIQESLAGRKRIIPIHPLSFSEHLSFMDREDLLQQLENLPNVQSERLPDLLPEAFRELETFLVFGGYPEVSLVKPAEKEEVLASIFDLYVKKDLVDFLKIERIAAVKTLIRQLAINHGQESTYSGLAQVAGIDEKTVKNYLEILKETFVITVHPPWFTNRNKELVKTPKIYFHDSGVRNYFISNFNASELRGDMPFLFEGFVVSELIKKGFSAQHIKFWRTKNRQEVDLVLEKGPGISPVEIKYKKQLRTSDVKGLRKFREAYPETTDFFLVNLGTNRMGREFWQPISPFELERLTGKPQFGGHHTQ